jgi:hypothetical protein
MALGSITSQNVGPGGSPSVLYDGNGLKLSETRTIRRGDPR